MTAMTTEAPVLGISVREAARLLGVSRSTVHRLAVDGSLPSFRVGKRRVLIDPVAIYRTVEARIQGDT